MTTTAAIDNAKTRASAGWPLILLAIAAWSPVGGWPCLALIATGVFFLVQTAPGHHPGKSRPAEKAPAGTRSNRTAAPKTAPAAKTSRPRNAEGKWIK